MRDASEHAVETLNPLGAGPVVLLCEHASNHIPAHYDGLGLTRAQQVSHVAWDPGARAVSLSLSKALDAPLVASRVSRLVYDCNRPPDSPGAITAQSETTDIPGNRGLTAAQRQERIESVYRPFCAAVDAVLDRRKALDLPTALVTIHSFTPVYFGEQRAVELGILHDTDSRLADAMLAEPVVGPVTGPVSGRDVRRNAPYGPEDGVTHSLQRHGIARGLANVMIELRNDLIRDDTGVARLTDELLRLLTPALNSVLGAAPDTGVNTAPKGSAQNA